MTGGAGACLVRRARPADVPRILELIRELADYERSLDQVSATADELRAALFAEQPAVFAHVAELNTAPARAGTAPARVTPPDPHSPDTPVVVGFAIWFVNFSTWLGRHGIYLEDLYVTPAVRGRGVGRALLAELAATCVRRGYGRLEWWVLDWNEPAMAFYRSVGAVPMSDWTVQRLSGTALADLASANGGIGDHDDLDHDGHDVPR